MSSSRATLAGLTPVLLLGCLALGVTGCYEGLPPTAQIPESGPPEVFLPPDMQLGTQPERGLLYLYDESKYVEYKNEGGRNQIPPETDRELYVRRNSLLSIINASGGQLIRPDTVDAVLASVYANPQLFGFEPARGLTPGFYEGAKGGNAADFMPACMADGNCAETFWVYNHKENKWRRRSFLAGTTSAPTNQGGFIWIVRDTNRVREGPGGRDRASHLPSVYAADAWWSVVPGRGLFVHGMTLTAERDNFPDALPPPRPLPERQNNPTFLWLAQLKLGARDPNQAIFTTLDQCLDAMWGDFDLHPLQLTGAELQVGDRYVTWTYVKTDADEIRRRVTEGNELEQLRCSGSGIPPLDVPLDSTAFPIFYFSLLARYEVSVEFVYDVLQWRAGTAVVGEYGTPDGVVDVVKLVVRMYVVAPEDALAQQVDLYLMRGIGPVVQQTGILVFDSSRLQEAQINGVYYPPETFKYVP